MCIRDSYHAEATQGFRGLGRRGVDADGGFRFETIKPGRVPVSYTHLRAHETVLDLVCRLLLEKKKNKTHI